MNDSVDEAVAGEEAGTSVLVVEPNPYSPPNEGWRKPIPDPEPQPGPQQLLQTSTADIIMIGGGAFGGKSFALLLEALRHVEDPEFRAVCFRREMPQIRQVGGLWDEAWGLYAPRGARLIQSPDMEAQWPSGSSIVFTHLQHEKTIYNWDSSQIPLLMFDQVESFEETQFWYLQTRNRDKSGHLRPYTVAACNPDPDGWLRVFLAWWIDDRQTIVVDGVEVRNPGYGYAYPERSGVVRWMVRVGDDIIWGNSREEAFALGRDPELPDDHPDQPSPTSVTFILFRMADNPIGTKKNPGYRSALMRQVKWQRERLLGDAERGGNWNARPMPGNYFRREWCNFIPVEPANVEWVRGWDLAATEVSVDSPSPDWTVGAKVGRYRGSRRFVVAADVKRTRGSPAKVSALLDATAATDGGEVRIRIPEDPGQAGKSQSADYITMLAGYDVKATRASGDKATRFTPFSRQAEAGNVDLVLGIPEEYLRCLEQFTGTKKDRHDDDVDATSEAFNDLTKGLKGEEILAYFEKVGAGVPAEGLAMKQTSMPGIADIVRAVRGEADAAKLPAKTAIVTMTVKASQPFARFQRSGPSGVRVECTADADGIIVERREIGGENVGGVAIDRLVPLTEQDVIWLVRAGCARVLA